MKKAIKFVITVAALSALIAFAASFAACGSAKADSVAMKNMPRTEYVQGQELDLSKGSISATVDGKEKEIALTSSDVQISGYDKNLLGKQTVTVNYGGQSCTFTVNVHGKIEAVDYIEEYVVGEKFNVAQGKLLIYREDGIAASSVRLNDASVTVDDAVFAQEGNASVTVSYNGDTTTLSVNVYSAESVKLHAPNKLSYKSHETELDLSGGYVTVTANNGNIVRRVPLAADMITGGFEPSAATADNIRIPLKQDISVSCLGQAQTFTVKVTYSYVTYVKACASELNGVALTELPDAMGKRSVAAIGGYFGLSNSDKELLTQEEVTSVVRAAAVYGKTAWGKLVRDCAGTVEIDDNGNYTFKPTSTPTGAKEDLDMLMNESNVISAIADSLRNIVNTFGGTIILDGKTAEEYIGNVMSGENVRAITDKLTYMLKLYEVYKDVTADNNEVAVSATLKCIRESEYKDFGCKDMYDAVASWHNAGDMFDLFFDYCYNAKDAEALKTVCNIGLVGDFEALYVRIASTLNAWADLYDYTKLDSTEFMLLFADAEAFAASVAAKGNGATADAAKTKWLYENMVFSFRGTYLPFEGLLEWLRVIDFGYYDNCHGSLGDGEFDALWRAYIAAVDARDSGVGKNDATEELLSKFVQASPSVQYAFIASVNTCYNELPHYKAVPEHALDYDENFSNSEFANIIFSHYTGIDGVLSAECQAIFRDLMIALEDYALRYYGGTKDNVKIDYLQQFLVAMRSAQTKYAALSDDDKTAFDSSLGYFYSKYSTIYGMYNADGSMKSVDLDEWKVKFDSLKSVVENVNKGYGLFGVKIYAYGAFVAGYEYAQSLAAELVACDNETIRNAYYYLDYSDGMSFDSALYALRETYVNALVKSEQDLWQQYQTASESFKAFMSTASPVMQMFVNQAYDIFYPKSNEEEVEDEKYYGAENKQNVINAINSFYMLSADEKILFYALDYTETGVSGITPFFLYDRALSGYFGVNLSENVAVAAVALFDWEYYDTAYEYNEKTDATAKDLTAAVTTFKALYEKLSETEIAEFNEYFGNMYSYYAERYEAIAPLEQ